MNFKIFLFFLLSTFLLSGCSQKDTVSSLLSREIAEFSSEDVISGVDHAPVSPKHVQHSEEFINKHLKENGHYNLKKVELFLERLNLEKKSLGEDLYETEMLEKLEFEVRDDYKKVEKSARKEMDEKKSELLQGYTLYLIPKIEALKKLVEAKGDIKLQEGLVDDFIRVYSVYYLPNYKRNKFYNDYHWPTMFKKLRKGFQYPRQTDKVEANNLMVEKHNQKDIEDCLQKPVAPGHYLVNEEVEKLKKDCEYDLSKINPGLSSFWKKIQPKDRERLKEEYNELFPREDEKIHFKRIRLSGIGSPKVSAYFERDGKKHDIKVKVGHEVHSEIATSFLARFMGFSSDIMSFRKGVKIYLGDTTYNEFKARFSHKYGDHVIARHIQSHGGEKGNEWIYVNDALIETDHQDDIRLEAYDPEAWDLNNRREHRGQILWYGWLNLMDTKAGNHKGILRKTDKGLVPEFRLQDVGLSLGRSLVSRGNIFGFISEPKAYGVNFFEKSFMSWNDDTVHIWWNDFINLQGRFTTTTYSDLKWMARQIAKISEEEIYFALKTAGIPEEIHDLYKHKLSNRRNEVIKAFDLEDEYPLYDVPELSTYSPNSYIKNGKVTKPYFKNHNEIEVNRFNFFTVLSSFLSFTLPLDTITKSFQMKIEETTKAHTMIRPVTIHHLAPGLGITLGRNVGPNNYYFNSNGKSRGFYVRDTLGIEINISTAFMKTVTTYLPASVSADIKVYRKEIQFTQYADTLAEAYKAPIKLFDILSRFNHYIAFSLLPGEVVRVLDAYGFSVKGSASYFNIGPLLTNEVGAQASWSYVTPAYFARDSFGELQIYKERSSTFGAGLYGHVGNVNLLFDSLPLLGVDFTFKAFFQESVLYSFKLPAYSSDVTALDTFQRRRDYEALNVFLRRGGDKALSSVMRINMHLKAKGYSHRSKLNFLYLFKNEWSRGYSTAKIDVTEGEERKFHRYYMDNSRSFGGPKNVPLNADLLQINYLKNSLVVEMDAKKPEDFVVITTALDYFRKKTRKGVLSLIEEQNEKYSESDLNDFYRNFMLPAADEINVYRKIYAENYVYVNGRGILDNLMNMPQSEFVKLAREFYFEGDAKRKRVNIASLTNSLKKKILFSRLIHHFRKLKSMKKVYKSRPRTFMKAVAQFFNVLDIPQYGVSLLQSLVKKDNMFVMGQIYGIYRSFTTLQQLEHEATRRFAGKHWGELVVPPLRKFLVKNNVMPIGYYVDSDINIGEIFGVLPEAKPVMP